MHVPPVGLPNTSFPGTEYNSPTEEGSQSRIPVAERSQIFSHSSATSTVTSVASVRNMNPNEVKKEFIEAVKNGEITKVRDILHSNNAEHIPAFGYGGLVSALWEAGNMQRVNMVETILKSPRAQSFELGEVENLTIAVMCELKFRYPSKARAQVSEEGAGALSDGGAGHALWLYAMSGDIANVQRILTERKDILSLIALDKYGFGHALYSAILNGNSDMVLAFLNCERIHEMTGSGEFGLWNIFLLLVRMERAEFISYFFSSQFDKNKEVDPPKELSNALKGAIQKGNLPLVEELMKSDWGKRLSLEGDYGLIEVFEFFAKIHKEEPVSHDMSVKEIFSSDLIKEFFLIKNKNPSAYLYLSSLLGSEDIFEKVLAGFKNDPIDLRENPSSIDPVEKEALIEEENQDVERSNDSGMDNIDGNSSANLSLPNIVINGKYSLGHSLTAAALKGYVSILCKILNHPLAKGIYGWGEYGIGQAAINAASKNDENSLGLILASPYAVKIPNEGDNGLCFALFTAAQTGCGPILTKILETDMSKVLDKEWEKSKLAPDENYDRIHACLEAIDRFQYPSIEVILKNTPVGSIPIVGSGGLHSFLKLCIDKNLDIVWKYADESGHLKSLEATGDLGLGLLLLRAVEKESSSMVMTILSSKEASRITTKALGTAVINSIKKGNRSLATDFLKHPQASRIPLTTGYGLYAIKGAVATTKDKNLKEMIDQRIKEKGGNDNPIRDAISYRFKKIRK